MSSSNPVTWRLWVVMAERDIRTSTDLQRRLQAIGVDISSAQLSRVVSGKPQRLSIELLEGLMTVLECDANALLSSRVDDRSTASRPTERTSDRMGSTAPSPRRSRNKSSANSGDITGPKVAPFPLAKRKQ